MHIIKTSSNKDLTSYVFWRHVVSHPVKVPLRIILSQRYPCPSLDKKLKMETTSSLSFSKGDAYNICHVLLFKIRQDVLLMFCCYTVFSTFSPFYFFF